TLSLRLERLERPLAVACSLEAKIGEIKLVDGDLARLQPSKLTGDGQARRIGDRCKERQQDTENDKGGDKVAPFQAPEPGSAAERGPGIAERVTRGDQGASGGNDAVGRPAVLIDAQSERVSGNRDDRNKREAGERSWVPQDATGGVRGIAVLVSI